MRARGLWGAVAPPSGTNTRASSECVLAAAELPPYYFLRLLTEDALTEPTEDLAELLRAAERAFAEAPNDAGTSRTGDIRPTLDRVESATAGGAPLHAQLDNVRKWLDALDRPADHERFGGTAHLRAYVLTQLRLALGALEDYQREMR